MHTLAGNPQNINEKSIKEVKLMDISGKQTIDCSVKSCIHNSKGKYCDLSRIQVEPDTTHNDTHSGSPRDESACASYRAK